MEEGRALALAQRLNAVLTSQAFTLGTLSLSCHGRGPAMAGDEPTNDRRSDADPNVDNTEDGEPSQLSRSKTPNQSASVCPWRSVTESCELGRSWEILASHKNAAEHGCEGRLPLYI
jgi:hypothetical protein